MTLEQILVHKVYAAALLKHNSYRSVRGGDSPSVLHWGKFQRLFLSSPGNDAITSNLASAWFVHVRQSLLASPPSAVVQEKIVTKENWHRTKLATQVQPEQ